MRIIGPIIALLTLIGFFALGYYSRKQEIGYTPAQVSAMEELVASATSDDYLTLLQSTLKEKP